MAASHRSLIQDQISDVTECSICAEIFTNPKILPCVHTFCLHCLETYGKENIPGEQMVCPICRKEFLIPKEGFSDLPSNFFIGKMVEIGKLAMTPMSKTLCALCPEEDEVLAQMFCVDCEQNLCSRCGNGHKKSRSSQHHQVIELGCQPRAKDLNFRNSYCGHHPEELIKMYCYEDKAAICLICCAESHQSHRCISANTAAKEFTEQLKCRSGKVASRIAECDELEEKLDKFKKEFQAKVLKTEEGIQEAANKTIKLIQQHTEQLVQRLKSVAERNLKAFETTKQDVDRFRGMIDSYSRYSEKLLVQGSPVDICCAVDQMLTRAQELETIPANCSGDRFCCDTLAFYPLDIQSQLTYGMINAVGDLIVTPSSDCLLQFGVHDESHVVDRVIKVINIPSDMGKNTLQMIFESRRFYGGQTDNIVYEQGQGAAVITFKDPEVADLLISKGSVVYKENRLSITRHLEKVESQRIPIQTREALESSNHTIFVTQIPQTLDECYLVMLFESKPTGGGKIKKVDYDKERGTAVITFEEAKVAAYYLEKEFVELNGQRILVSMHKDPAADAGRGNARDDSNARAKEMPGPRHAVSGSFNTVRVSGLPQSASKDMISMYFQNKKRSGGGRLRILEHQKEKGKAFIKFDDPEDGLEVCNRTHTLAEATLQVSALEMALDDVKSCAIEVKGLGERATVGYLELYFETTTRSGGSMVEEVFLDNEARTAVIVFEEATSVMGVMKKEHHELEKVQVEVNVLEPAPPPPLILKDVDAKRLLAKRLPPSATRDSLKQYLSSVAKARMVGWTQAVKRSTALLDFSTEPDYLSIRRLVCSKPFLGKMISIQRVPQTSSILVTGIPPRIVAEFVGMYFENTRNGGSGDDCKVEMLPDGCSAIVNLQRPDVIRAITSKQHQFEKKDIRVEPYYPWLGLISASQSSGKPPARTKSGIPTSVTCSFDPRSVHFILQRPELQKHIEDSLGKLNCCIVWPSEGKGEVNVEFKLGEQKKPTSGWDAECKKVLQRYADELTWKKENVLQEIWNDFKKKIQEYATQSKSKMLHIAFENDQCEIQYVGLKKYTDEFEQLFKKVKGELEEALARKMKKYLRM